MEDSWGFQISLYSGCAEIGKVRRNLNNFKWDRNLEDTNLCRRRQNFDARNTYNCQLYGNEFSYSSFHAFCYTHFLLWKLNRIHKVLLYMIYTLRVQLSRAILMKIIPRMRSIHCSEYTAHSDGCYQSNKRQRYCQEQQKTCNIRGKIQRVYLKSKTTIQLCWNQD